MCLRVFSVSKGPYFEQCMTAGHSMSWLIILDIRDK
jgi:hypothetical protein